MKVKLLEPIDGYEDVADYLIPEAGQTVWCEGSPLTPTTLPFGYHLILTKKKTLLESLEIQVGESYFREGRVVIEITGPDSMEYHDAGKTRGEDSPLVNLPLDFAGWRKVINADGSMVDGDVEWVTVGNHLVTKADLRAAHYEWVCPF